MTRRVLIGFGAIALLIASAAPALSDVASTLRRYPYITDAIPGSVTVNWATSTSGTGTVRFGEEGGSCADRAATASSKTIWVGPTKEYQFRATLTGLTPGVRYCYRPMLGSNDLLGTDPAPAFTAALAAGDTAPFSFAVLGSWGYPYGSLNAHQQRLYAQVASSGVDLALGSGGVAYNGAQADYGDLRSSSGGVFGPDYWTLAGSSIPMFPAEGNKGAFFPFVTNWAQPRAVATSKGKNIVETYCCLNGTRSQNLASTWYAFDYGRVRFYVLDAAWPNGNAGTGSIYENDYAYHWQPTSPEMTWLRSDLEAHPDGLKFAFFNFPLYSDGKGHGTDAYLNATAGPDSLENVLAAYGTKFVFNGHAHIYERNAPSSTGIVSYVTGGGGAPLDPMGTCRAYDEYAVGWNESTGVGSACGSAPTPSSAGEVFHFVRVDVTSTSVTITGVNENGTEFDAQTYDV
jgi:Purple acid Phosphatase, N-terminal domain